MTDLSHVILWFVLINPISPEAEKLISQLNNKDYNRREVATHKLKQMGWQAIPSLEYAVRKGDLETARRCQSIINSFYYLKHCPSLYNPNYYYGLGIGSRNIYSLDIDSIYAEYMRKAENNYSLALFLWRSDMLRLGVPRKLIDPYVNQAYVNDVAFSKLLRRGLE